MPSSRWDNIIQAVLENLSKAGIKDYDKGSVLLQLKTLEIDIAQDALCIQGTAEITTAAAQEAYPLPAAVYRIARFFYPAGWTRPISIIDDFNDWQAIVADTHLNGEQPTNVFVWGGYLYFRAKPVDVQTINLWTYNIPADDPAPGGAPEVPSQYDQALEYGCTGRLLAKIPAQVQVGATWLARFNDEMKTHKQKDLNRGFLGANRVAHSSDNLGF